MSHPSPSGSAGDECAGTGRTCCLLFRASQQRITGALSIRACFSLSVLWHRAREPSGGSCARREMEGRGGLRLGQVVEVNAVAVSLVETTALSPLHSLWHPLHMEEGVCAHASCVF